MTSTLSTTTGAATGADSGREAPLTLDETAPRTLGLADHLGMWGNLGVSLLGFTGAIYVLTPVDGAPALAFGAALLAIVLGTVLGTAAVSIAAVPGAQTGQPSMVLLRGLFGAKLSWLPTTLNIVQLLGWTAFELVTISTALSQVVDGVPRWVWVLLGGAVTVGLSLRPLGWIRVLRRYVTVLVMIAMAWFAIQLLRNPLPGLGDGSWQNFWVATDTVIAVSVSWVPVVADYTRHSRTVRSAAWGTFAGYSVTQILCYAIGLVTLVTVARGDADQVFGAFLAVPLGALAFAVLAVRELDQSFVDAYSSGISVQNLLPRVDRRILTTAVGVLATLGAIVLDIEDYGNFLTLLGSVFVPLLGVLAVDWFLVSRGRWDLSEQAPLRPLMLLPWLVGFATYQVINPGYIGWWGRMWSHVRWFDQQSWMSASVLSFAVAAVVTVPIAAFDRRMSARPSRGR
ncbi:putative hydroxymethylpyrimidine transporter CytX [Jatrophihabitans endophyticus]|uniref:Putative hydroxymethylpyrimidine transporter CytX n=1 Tax=Jatrophihabitans endophyticus TaxID=1206085 RepID=A0A1M5C7E7_9ACTN|nr:cytosine permease [Jatrophihabitans endophyticus]SHF50673.1 putative hydroxymethylpyrimidine transporter CytX [Jatrophihabitans endophyticus]